MANTRSAHAAPRAALACCLVTMVLVTPGLAQEPGQQEFYHDFRGRPLPPELVLYQAVASNLVQIEPEGLRITLPADFRHPAGGVGVRTTFAVRGDFEATATVEIVHLEPPPRGAGAGIGIAIDASGKGTQLRRVIGAKGNPSLLSTGFVQGFKGPQWGKEYRSQCADTLLRLRLARTGTQVHYAWAPGKTGDDFVEVHQDDFGTDDIDHVRVMALNAQQPCLVDVRVLDLRIRTSQQGNVTPPATPPASRSWLAAAILVGLVLTLLLASGVALLVYRQRQSQA